MTTPLDDRRENDDSMIVLLQKMSTELHMHVRDEEERFASALKDALPGLIEPRRWHIDKTIPLVLIVAFITQTLVGVWWVSTFAAKTETKIEAMEMRQIGFSQLPERMARQEVQLTSILDTLKDVKNDLRSLNKGVSK